VNHFNAAPGSSTSRFLAFASAGSLFYATVYIAAGFAFHDQVRPALAFLTRLSWGALLLALVLISGYIRLKYARRRRLGGAQRFTHRREISEMPQLHCCVQYAEK
jgi:hypothetical protein